MKRPLIPALIFLISGVLVGYYHIDIFPSAVLAVAASVTVYLYYRRKSLLLFLAFFIAGYVAVSYRAGADPDLSALVGEKIVIRGIVGEPPVPESLDWNTATGSVNANTNYRIINAPEGAMIIAAQYDANRLIDIKTFEANVVNKDFKVISSALSIKVFALDGLAQIKPLSANIVRDVTN